MRRVLLLLLLGVYLGGVVHAAPAIPRVRPLSDRSDRLLAVGRELSPTIKAMLARVEASDIIMQLDLSLDMDVPNAVTRLVTSTPDFRYVRVSINPRLSPLRRLELLAHELQHVLEIAADPTVRTQHAMRDYFTRIGRRERHNNAFETDAAINVEHVVRAEVGKWESRRLKPLDR